MIADAAELQLNAERRLGAMLVDPKAAAQLARGRQPGGKSPGAVLFSRATVKPPPAFRRACAALRLMPGHEAAAIEQIADRQVAEARPWPKNNCRAPRPLSRVLRKRKRFAALPPIARGKCRPRRA
jgi:hypothetical protein